MSAYLNLGLELIWIRILTEGYLKFQYLDILTLLMTVLIILLQEIDKLLKTNSISIM